MVDGLVEAGPGVDVAPGGLHGAGDIAPAGAAGVDVVAHGHGALGDDHQLVAFMLHQPSQDFLGAAFGVAVGAVEEVDAQLAAGTIHLRGLRFVRIAAERHRAVTQRRYFNSRST